MARVYYGKSTGEKMVDGAVAGLVGGAVVLAVMFLVDALTPNRSWWTTPSIIGSLFTNVQDFNTTSPDMASLLLGVLLHFSIVALIGVGFVFYRPLFFRFNINLMVGGAIYAAVMWLLVYLIFFNFIRPDIPARLNMIVLLIAMVIGGAAMGWWFLLRNSGRPTSQATTTTTTTTEGTTERVETETAETVE